MKIFSATRHVTDASSPDVTPPTLARSTSVLLARAIPRALTRLGLHRAKTEPIRMSAFCVTPATSTFDAHTPLALSPLECSRLASVYGVETVLQRIEHDVFSDVAALERQLAHEHRVDFFVKDYASLNPSAIPDGWTFNDKFIHHEHGLVELRTVLRGPAGECGKVVRSFDGHTLHLNKAYKSSLPTRLAGIPGMGRPAATVNYMTARACKLLGVTTENLRQIKINRLQHRPTLAHLDWLKHQYPGKTLSTLIGHTTWARNYVRQTATNIGHALQENPDITLESSREWHAAHPNACHRDWDYMRAETERLTIKHYTGQKITKIDDVSNDWKESAAKAIENFKVRQCRDLGDDAAENLRNEIDATIKKHLTQIDHAESALAQRYGLNADYKPRHLNFDVTFRTQPERENTG